MTHNIKCHSEHIRFIQCKLREESAFIFLILFFIFTFLSNIYSATFDYNNYTLQELDNSAESSISSAYNANLPYPCIGFAYGGRTGLYYAAYDTSLNKWNINTVETGENIGKEISLQVDNHGKPHVSYIDQNKKCLKYAYYDTSNGWNIKILDESSELE